MMAKLSFYYLHFCLLSTQIIHGVNGIKAEHRPPGSRVIISASGLKFMGEYAEKEMKKFFADHKDEMNFSIRTPLVSAAGGEKSSEEFLMKDLTPTSVNDDFQSTFTPIPGFGLLWKTSKVTLDMTGLWSGGSQRRRSSSNNNNGGRSNGRIRTKVFRMTISILIGSNVDHRTGNANAIMEDCHIDIERQSSLVSRKRKALNNRLRRSSRKIRKNLEQFMGLQLCDVIMTELWDPVMKKRLFTFSSEDKLETFGGAQMYQSNRLTDGFVDFAENHFESFHAADIFSIYPNGTEGRSGVSSLIGVPLEDDSKAMFQFYMSPTTVRTKLQRLFEAGRFDFDFTPRTASKELKLYFRTSCNDICAGTLFPALEDKFGNKGMVAAIGEFPNVPEVTFSANQLNIAFSFNLGVWVSPKPNAAKAEWVPFFNSSADFSMIIKDFVVEQKPKLKLTAEPIIKDYKEISLESYIPSIKAKDISVIGTLLVDNILTPNLSQLFNEGIYIPQLVDFPMVGIRQRFTKDSYRLEADMCHPTECEQLEEIRYTTAEPSESETDDPLVNLYGNY